MGQVVITILDGSTIVYKTFDAYCNQFSREMIFHSYNDIPCYKSDLVEEWRHKGLLHREVGPAYVKYDSFYGLSTNIMPNVSSRLVVFKEYFLGGVRYKEQQFYLELEQVDKMDLVLQLIDDREWVRERAKNKQKEIENEKQK